MSNTPKELPNRRDLRDATGYLSDLIEANAGHVAATEELVSVLIEGAQSVKVQRSADLLVIKFDLSAEPGALPPADDTEKVIEGDGKPKTEAKGGTVPPRTAADGPAYSAPSDRRPVKDQPQA